MFKPADPAATDDTALDARAAAAIAAGMKAVALADGEPHPRELAMIDAFVGELPADIDVSGVRFDDAGTRGVLLHSLFLVALADGHLGADERATIEEIGRAHGADLAEFDAAEQTVRKTLLGTLRGVRVFREQALAVADDLGIPEVDAAMILDGDD